MEKLKYFDITNISDRDYKMLKYIDEEWKKRENDQNWYFISKNEIKTQKGFDLSIWNRIIDLIPCQIGE